VACNPRGGAMPAAERSEDRRLKSEVRDKKDRKEEIGIRK